MVAGGRYSEIWGSDTTHLQVMHGGGGGRYSEIGVSDTSNPSVTILVKSGRYSKTKKIIIYIILTNKKKEKMANLNFTGRITKIGETKSGDGKNGAWVSTTFVVEDDAQYPNSIAFTAFNKQEIVDKLEVGKLVDVSYNAKVNDNNSSGNIFNSLNVWKVDFKDGEQSQTTSSTTQHQITNVVTPPPTEDDLPF